MSYVDHCKATLFGSVHGLNRLPPADYKPQEGIEPSAFCFVVLIKLSLKV